MTISSFITSTGRKVFKGNTGLWETCVGLEIHAQILSVSKLFSGSSARLGLSSIPNSKVSFFDAALPGTLPIVNKECVHQAIRTGLSLNSSINSHSLFERKHYFYCDLPHGYQITQQRAPIASGGYLTITSDYPEIKLSKEKSIRINRIQLEVDSGKSIHDIDDENTFVDLNRAGTALMEIVMEPDLRSGEDAGLVLRKLQHLLRHIGTCDGNMEDGSIRCDLNVSVRKIESEEDLGTENNFGERAEVKNMNSIRNLVRAAEYEAIRQIEHIEKTGTSISRETRSFDPVNGKTYRMRTKETAKDYRFFPDPDLPPLYVSPKIIEDIRNKLPELPDILLSRLSSQYGISKSESTILVNEPHAAEYFERIAKVNTRPTKLVCNWILNDLFSLLRSSKIPITECPINTQRMGELLDMIVDGTISGKIAKELLPIMFYEDDRFPIDIVEERGWKLITNSDEIKKICMEVIHNPKLKKNLVAYHAGKKQLFGFFVGQVMKHSNGKVHPERTNKIIRELIDS